MRMRLRLAAGLSVLLLAARVGAAEEAYQSYEDGVKALAAGDCARAATLLQAAAAKDGKESAKKRTYGMNFIAYHPHLYLAKAYACLGDTARATQELQTCEAQGAYKGTDIAALRSQLQAKATPETPPPTTPPPPDPKVAQAKAAFDAGVAFYNQKMWERSVTSLKEAAALDPGNAEARRYLDLAMKEQQKKASVERLVADAQRALDQKDAATAKTKVDAALKLDPGSAAAKALVPRIEALQASVPATPTAPTTPPVDPKKAKAAEELAAGRKLLQEGRHAEAVAKLDAANRLDPGNLEIMGALAEAQQKKTDADRIAKAVAEVPEIRRLVQGGRLSDARTRVNQALTLDPKNADLLKLQQEINAKLAAVPTPPATTPPATPTGKATPTAAVAGNKEMLKDGVRAFYSGQVDDALQKLAAAEPECASLPTYHLYLGASYLTKYLLSGEKDAALKANATLAFKKARSLDPALRPDPKLLSPRIVEAYQTAQ